MTDQPKTDEQKRWERNGLVVATALIGQELDRRSRLEPTASVMNKGTIGQGILFSIGIIHTYLEQFEGMYPEVPE